MIVPLSRELVEQVARLHCACLPGLLSRLGVAAARAFYAGCLASGAAIAFADVEGAQVRGFVLGSLRPDRLRRAALRANFAGTLLGILAGALKRPAALAWLAWSLKGPDEGGYDAAAPELTYVAVAADRRARGIGERLVGAFTRALRERGARACELSVDEDNRQALAMYERLGFHPIGRYREFGVRHLRCRLELSAR